MLEGYVEKGTLLHSWWEWKLVQSLLRRVWRLLKKLEIELPYNPTIPLLGIHTEETRIKRDTCTAMFIAAAAAAAKSLQSCLTLCDPIDSSPPGILQARVLEWVPLSSPVHCSTFYNSYDMETT